MSRQLLAAWARTRRLASGPGGQSGQSSVLMLGVAGALLAGFLVLASF